MLKKLGPNEAIVTWLDITCEINSLGHIPDDYPPPSPIDSFPRTNWPDPLPKGKPGELNIPASVVISDEFKD